MNGPHDMGGDQGFPPIEIEASHEESGLGHFHEDWEKSVLTMALVSIGAGLYPIEAARYARERQFPGSYLERSYYETWLYGLVLNLIESEAVTADEMIEMGLITQDELDMAMRLREQALAEPSILRSTEMTPPRYQVGDPVRAIVQHTAGHTREPGYTRGRVGVIEHVYDNDDPGAEDARTFADVRGTSLEMIKRPLYTVRFRASELWGVHGEENGYVHVNMWEDYLEPAL